MNQALIRYLRFHCAFPGAALEHRREGIVAVAAIQEHASLAWTSNPNLRPRRKQLTRAGEERF